MLKAAACGGGRFAPNRGGTGDPECRRPRPTDAGDREGQRGYWSAAAHRAGRRRLSLGDELREVRGVSDRCLYTPGARGEVQDGEVGGGITGDLPDEGETGARRGSPTLCQAQSNRGTGQWLDQSGVRFSAV